VRDATTVIAEGVRVIGDVAGDGNVEVHGRLQGDVHIGGELRIGPGGMARSDVVAARVRVDGHLEGRVRATQQVAIGAQGTLVGEVQGLLAVEEGGVFRGTVELEAPDLAGTTMEAPPIVESHPGQPLHRLEAAQQAQALRLPQRRRSATEPSVDREAVITRKMPQVRGDSSHPLLPAGRRAEASGARPDTTTPAQPRSARPPEPPRPPDPPRRPRSAPPRPKQAARPPHVPRGGMVRTPPSPHRAVAPPHPPRRKGAGRQQTDSQRLAPGDPVEDRPDLTDEWFEEEDYLLKDR